MLAATALFYGVVLLRMLVWGVTSLVKRRPARMGWPSRVLFAIAALGLAIMAYGHWIEPRRVEVLTVQLAAPELAGAQSLRIVQISDVHSPSNLCLQRRVPDLVAGLDPDLIVFTGDAINDERALPDVRALFSALAAIAPTYLVRGNRDQQLPPEALTGSTGAVEVTGEPRELDVGGVRVVLVGASHRGDWMRVRAQLRRQSDDAYVIYLAHSPDVADDVSGWGADLCLAGHTHGGQVALPFYGAVWTGSRHGKRFEHGLYDVAGMPLYINRGIGFEALLPKLRIGARPEITLLHVRP